MQRLLLAVVACGCSLTAFARKLRKEEKNEKAKANVAVVAIDEVKGSIYCEDGAVALLSGTAKLPEFSPTKVRLQVTVQWYDPEGMADGKVKTELIINNDKGEVTLSYLDVTKDSSVTGTLR